MDSAAGSLRCLQYQESIYRVVLTVDKTRKRNLTLDIQQSSGSVMASEPTSGKFYFDYQGEVKWFSILHPIHMEQRRLSCYWTVNHTIHACGKIRFLGHLKSLRWV